MIKEKPYKETEKIFKKFKKEGFKVLGIEIYLSDKGIACKTEANKNIFETKELSPIICEFSDKINELINDKL